MSRRLIVRPEAEADIAAAYRWYEAQRPRLGEEFIDAISSCLDHIQAHPEQYPRIDDSIRRALVQRFPYAIFFVGDVETVSILAALHMARNPAVWRRRV